MLFAVQCRHLLGLRPAAVRSALHAYQDEVDSAALPATWRAQAERALRTLHGCMQAPGQTTWEPEGNCDSTKRYQVHPKTPCLPCKHVVSNMAASQQPGCHHSLVHVEGCLQRCCGACTCEIRSTPAPHPLLTFCLPITSHTHPCWAPSGIPLGPVLSALRPTQRMCLTTSRRACNIAVYIAV